MLRVCLPAGRRAYRVYSIACSAAMRLFCWCGKYVFKTLRKPHRHFLAIMYAYVNLYNFQNESSTTPKQRQIKHRNIPYMQNAIQRHTVCICIYIYIHL